MGRRGREGFGRTDAKRKPALKNPTLLPQPSSLNFAVPSFSVLDPDTLKTQPKLGLKVKGLRKCHELYYLPPTLQPYTDTKEAHNIP